MKTRRLRLMGSLIFDNARHFLLAIGSTVFTVSIQLLTPLILAEVADAIIGDAPLQAPAFVTRAFEAIGGRAFVAQNLWVVSLVVIGLSLVRGVFLYIRGRSTAKAAEQAALTLRERLYKHLLTLPYNYHVKAETGDLIQRCTSDVETTRRFLATQLVEAVGSALMIGISLAVLLGRNVSLTLISTAVIVPLFLFAYLFFKLVIKYFRISDEAEGKMSAVLQENLTGVRVVRAFGRQRFEVEKFDEKSTAVRKTNDKLIWLLSVYWSTSDFLTMVQMCLMLLFNVIYAAEGLITVGTVTVYASYIGMILWPVRQLGRILSDAGKALVSLERIDEILRQPSETDAEHPIRPDLTGDIVFDHVSFRYEDARPVLEDVSFTAQAGQTVAILGATGCGKSTLMHLLQRLYEPTEGRITIGGAPLAQIEKHYLRGHIGLMLQEPFLYSKTIRDNVRVARRDASDEAVAEAARVAQADAFIRESEKGYETLVGERGVTLSGGQKQRVAIARTLMKDNQVLIFDDSLSAVDTQTDAAIRKALTRRRKGVTTFIISHRVTTLAEADLILVMEQGKIAQQGTHAQLIETPGLYQRIYSIQSGIEDELYQDAGATA